MASPFGPDRRLVEFYTECLHRHSQVILHIYPTRIIKNALDYAQESLDIHVHVDLYDSFIPVAGFTKCFAHARNAKRLNISTCSYLCLTGSPTTVLHPVARLTFIFIIFPFGRKVKRPNISTSKYLCLTGPGV